MIGGRLRFCLASAGTVVLTLGLAAAVIAQTAASGWVSAGTQVLFGFATSHPSTAADRATYLGAQRVVRELGYPKIQVVWSQQHECDMAKVSRAGESVACEDSILGRAVILVTPALTAEVKRDGADRLAQVIAHETVHSIQTPDEISYLRSHPKPWAGIVTNGHTPAGVEGTAECGSLVLAHAHGLALSITKPASYLSTCGPAQMELARDVVFHEPMGGGE